MFNSNHFKIKLLQLYYFALIPIPTKMMVPEEQQYRKTAPDEQILLR
jgi:hypothetical protein